ncbi:MAG: hypothetical protein Q4F74_07535, partial [Synergistaceae bacterium]|nr:hypothetical protein [Synergistaceae bacterium]
MIVTLQDQMGQLRTAKVGFSWTVLFFGSFVPICRGDVKWAMFMLLASLLTVWLARIVFSFTYNGTYIRGLLERGYVPT